MKAKHFLLVALALMAGCTKPEDDNEYPKPIDPSQDVAVTGIIVSPGSAQLTVGATVTLTATITPDNATDKTVTWSSSDSGIATVAGGLVTGVAAGSATITAKAGDKTATCAVTVTSSDPPADVPEGAVDLGLSVYWGTSNVGTDEWSPRGRYYGWGETYEHRSSEGERKYRSYDWPTYKWCNYPSGNIGVPPSYIKYFSDPVHGSNPDYKTELDPEDDAAHVVLGGEWRMPTAQEFEELKATKNNAGYRWEWKTIDDVEGMEITYLKNGASIFLQASGYKYLNQQDVFNESMGHYWSSTKVEDNDHRAKSYVFGAFQQYKLDDYRCYGCNIRPVLPK